MDEQEKEKTKPKLKKPDKKAQEIESLKERLMRQQAEFENYKKRSRSELEEMGRYGVKELMVPLLSVVDNFQRALGKEPDAESAKAFYDGVDMIYRQFMDILEGQGLARIPGKGEAFDPAFHEGVMREAVQDPELDNTVLEEFQAGYRLKDKVIRPAMVKVGILE